VAVTISIWCGCRQDGGQLVELSSKPSASEHFGP
jgi:hypothetical protein